MDRSDLLVRLAARIAALDLPHPTRVGIDGVDTSGKTTLADALADELRSSQSEVMRASIDDFHNPRAFRYRQGPDSPVGYYADAFNLPALRQNLLDPLGPAGSRAIHTALFNYRTDTPVEGQPVMVGPRTILLFDGVFLLRPELAGAWDLTIFLQVDFNTVLARAAARDQALFGRSDQVVARYTRRYLPAQQHYLQACRPDFNADIIIQNDDPDHPVILRGKI